MFQPERDDESVRLQMILRKVVLQVWDHPCDEFYRKTYSEEKAKPREKQQVRDAPIHCRKLIIGTTGICGVGQEKEKHLLVSQFIL